MKKQKNLSVWEQIVMEIRGGTSKKDTTSIPEALNAVRRSVTEEFGLCPSRVVAIKERSIPKTTSGKIQRRKTRTLLHEGSLQVVSELSPTSADKPRPSVHLKPPPPPQVSGVVAAKGTRGSVLVDLPPPPPPVLARASSSTGRTADLSMSEESGAGRAAAVAAVSSEEDDPARMPMTRPGARGKATSVSVGSAARKQRRETRYTRERERAGQGGGGYMFLCVQSLLRM